MRDAKEDLKLCEKATLGPWKDNYNDGDWGACVESLEEGSIVATTEQRKLGAQFRFDAEFIASAREALPYWIERAEQAEAENTQLRAAFEMAETAHEVTIDELMGVVEENKRLRAAVEVTEKAHLLCIDEVFKVWEENGKLRAILFCKECDGTGIIKTKGSYSYYDYDYDGLHKERVIFDITCPTCGPLREQLRRDE